MTDESRRFDDGSEKSSDKMNDADRKCQNNLTPMPHARDCCFETYLLTVTFFHEVSMYPRGVFMYLRRVSMYLKGCPPIMTLNI